MRAPTPCGCGRAAWRAGAAVCALAVTLALAGSASAGMLADRVFETVLPNGLKVLILEEHKAPVVSVQIWYKAGSRNEPEGKTGLAHMLEHMMFKGTPKVGPKQFDLLVTRSGGINNAVTRMDATAYYEDFAADRVVLGLELEADRMTGLLLDEKEFLSERQVVAEERRLRIEDQPSNVLGEVMRATTFIASPYGRPSVGWPSDIQGWTRDDLARFYRTYYAPNNATLVVVGAVKKDELLPKIQALFGPIPRQPAPPPVITKEPPQQGERRVYVRKEAELPLLFVVHHVPPLTHPDSQALSVLAGILGGGESARFHQAVVYKSPIASYAGADYNPVRIDPVLFGLSAGPLPGKTADEVERALLAEVERLQRDGVTDPEVRKAKKNVQATFVFAMDSVSRLASLLGEYESVAGWRLLDEYLDRLEKVTAADVQRVARQYLVADNRTVAILIPVQPGAAGATGK
jgi:zinc protease